MALGTPSIWLTVSSEDVDAIKPGDTLTEVGEWLPPVCFQLRGRRTSKRSNCLSGDGTELHLIRRKALGRLAQSTQPSVPGSPEFQTMPTPCSPHTPAHTFPTTDILSLTHAGLASLRLYIASSVSWPNNL